MATFYSPHFTDETPNGTALAVVAKDRVKAPSGTSRNREYYTRAAIDFSAQTDASMASGDVIRMFSLKSGDRITNLLLSDTGFSATLYGGHIGLYKSGSQHDGSVIDADIFASGRTYFGNSRFNAFTESTTLDGTDYGRELWQLTNKSSATSYTADPQEDWDVCLTVSVTPNVTTYGTIVLECAHCSQLGA